MITIDFETRSYADLPKVGTWAYSQDPSTDTVCVCWGAGEQIFEWWPDHMCDEMPGDTDAQNELLEQMFDDIKHGQLIEAHNVAFERSVWDNVLHPKYGWPKVPDNQWRDTMATCAYYAMPMALDRACRALGYEPKSPEGSRLISKYSKMNLKTAHGPNPIPEEDMRKFVEYCVHDVRMEQSLSDELGDLPDRELPYFLFDQKVNMRGLYLDVPGIEAATKMVDLRQIQLGDRFKEITGCTGNQRNKIVEWFAEQGVVLETMRADHLEELIEDGEIPAGPARDAMDLRLRINKASTKKLDAMSRQLGTDERAKFQTRYHGAQTGRNTGAGFQPLNLTRGIDGMDPDQLVRDIMLGDPELLDMLYGDANTAISAASRYWIKAAPGNKIIAGDYVSVEAVILACLAGETWKVEAFREGVKLYEHMADKIYGLPAGTVTKATHPTERQDGKTGELAFGYQGALGAWLKFDSSGRHSDERIIEICKAWRVAHPNIVNFWYDMERASKAAVKQPGLVQEVGAGKVAFEVVDEWLSMILPNGKRIWYRDPLLVMGRPAWHKPVTEEDCADGTCSCGYREQLSYMAQKTGQWKRIRTYGGKLTENCVQATSREILMQAALRLEDAGYPVILTVYDEVVTEPPLDFGSQEELVRLMSIMPEWAADWPITVDPWEGDRYKK